MRSHVYPGTSYDRPALLFGRHRSFDHLSDLRAAPPSARIPADAPIATDSLHPIHATARSDDTTNIDENTLGVARKATHTALDTWHSLLAEYLGIRSLGVSDSGEAYPETTAGDVRRVAMLLSRELCLPRYDFANLGATRIAWRDAVARTNTLCTSADWRERYPENERFWLSDTLALAQRLATVDIRRSSIINDQNGLIRLLGDRADALTTWNDLRHFLLQRRPIRIDQQSARYPETTVGDVLQVAQCLNDELRRTVGLLGDRQVPIHWHIEVLEWRKALEHLAATARGQAFNDTYADNARFWRDSRRFAIRLAVYRDLSAEVLA